MFDENVSTRNNNDMINQSTYQMKDFIDQDLKDFSDNKRSL
jgi:hypothetical protein